VELSVCVAIKQEYGKGRRTPTKGFNVDELVVRAVMNDGEAGNAEIEDISPHIP
jgi:hypothetical protein